jgi:hypothetical protein
MGSQFDALDEDGGGTIEKHEVPPEIWAELDKHFNKDGDFEISRSEYMAAVKEAMLTQPLTVAGEIHQIWPRRHTYHETHAHRTRRMHHGITAAT